MPQNQKSTNADYQIAQTDVGSHIHVIVGFIDQLGQSVSATSNVVDASFGSPPGQLSGNITLSSATEHVALAAGTTVATFTDSDATDAASGFTASINWGDGTTSAGTVSGSNGSFAVAGGHTYADEGSDPLSVTVTRTADNSQAVATGTVTVGENDVLTPHGTTISAVTHQALSNVMVATFTDSDLVTPASDLVATINWGDGTTTAGTVSGSNGSFAVAGSHTYTAVGSDTVSVTLTDDAPGTAMATASSTAAVVGGTLAAQAVLTSATEHVALAAGTTVATFTDSDATDAASGFTASINWGDGTTSAGTVSGSNGSFAVAGGHTYADEGSDPLSVTVTRTADNSQAVATGTVTVGENDVLTPHGTTISANPGQSFSGTVASFTDSDSSTTVGDLTATINWGDGTTSAGIVSGSAGAFAVSGTHTYASSGQDAVTVTLSDDAPGTATATANSTANVGAKDHPPVITSDGGGNTASIIITDDSKYVATVHATDPDPGTAIKYSIAGGADQKLFAIDPKTGVLSFKSEPRDGHDYQVTVAASDGTLQDTQALKVHVADGPSMVGNPGVPDMFVFKQDFELAIVRNFDAVSANHDVLELDHALFRNADVHSSPAAIFSLIENHSFQFGHDVVIVTDTHDFIDLKNTDIHKLTAGDFVLI